MSDDLETEYYGNAHDEDTISALVAEVERLNVENKSLRKMNLVRELKITELIEMLQQVYLTDTEGSSSFNALNDKVCDCLFNNMGYSGDQNLFAIWQEDQNDKLQEPIQ